MSNYKTFLLAAATFAATGVAAQQVPASERAQDYIFQVIALNDKIDSGTLSQADSVTYTEAAEEAYRKFKEEIAAKGLSNEYANTIYTSAKKEYDVSDDAKISAAINEAIAADKTVDLTQLNDQYGQKQAPVAQPTGPSPDDLYNEVVELEGKFLRAKYKQSQTNDRLERTDLENEKLEALAGIKEIRETNVLEEGQFEAAEAAAQREYITWVKDYNALQAGMQAAEQGQVQAASATDAKPWPEPGSDPLPEGTLILNNGDRIDFGEEDRKGRKKYGDVSYVHVPKGASVQLINAPLDALTIIYPEGTVVVGDNENGRGQGDFTAEAYDENGLKTKMPIARVTFDDAQKTIERSNSNTNNNTNRNTNQNVNAGKAGTIIVDEAHKAAKGQKTGKAAARDGLFGVLRQATGALGNHNRNKNKNKNENTNEQTLPADYRDLNTGRKGDLYSPPKVPKADIQAGKAFGSIDVEIDDVKGLGSLMSNEIQIAVVEEAQVEKVETGFRDKIKAKREAAAQSRDDIQIG